MTDAELERFRGVAVADVYKAGVLAATLARSPEGVEFRYVDDYLALEAAPSVATTLPRTDHPTLTPSGAVPPFFAGLLPEGRRLSSLRRAVKTSADDELSLLLAVGKDTIGNVQVVPRGEMAAPAEPLILVDRDWSEVRFSDVLAEANIDRVGLPGAQEKASAGMISVPVGKAGSRYILKVDPPEYPHVVENEAFFLALARQAKVRSATAEIVTDSEDRPGLLVTRFDRLSDPSGSAFAVACEDACQVLGRWPADKYNLSCEEAVTALADRCPARAVAGRTLYQQVCFAWLTGNGDLHAKNLSILATREGEWRVAPAYDLPSTLLYGDTTFALPLQERVQGISRQRLLAFGEAVGLPPRVCSKVLDDLLHHLADLDDQLASGDLPFSPREISDLRAGLRFRRNHASPS